MSPHPSPLALAYLDTAVSHELHAFADATAAAALSSSSTATPAPSLTTSLRTPSTHHFLPLPLRCPALCPCRPQHRTPARHILPYPSRPQAKSALPLPQALRLSLPPSQSPRRPLTEVACHPPQPTAFFKPFPFSTLLVSRAVLWGAPVCLAGLAPHTTLPFITTLYPPVTKYTHHCLFLIHMRCACRCGSCWRPTECMHCLLTRGP